MRAYEMLTEDQTADEKNISILVNKLIKASDAYYNTGETTMSDANYDALESLLRDLDPDNPYFIGIGSDTRGGKVKLPVSMGSLDQAHEGDTVKWINNESLNDILMVASDKLDGNALLIVYNDNGDLQIALTRGNGVYGKDVTRHVRQMKNIPKKVNGIRYAIAEVIMDKDTFARLKPSLEKEAGKEVKNARNYVAGQMNSTKAMQLFYDNVSVVAFGTRDANTDKIDQYKKLADNGFTIAGYKTFKGSELSDDALTSLLSNRHDQTPFELDGIVIDINDAVLRDKMEAARNTSSLNPAYSRKFKVGQADNVAVSRVTGVEWKVSKDGYIKPTVLIEPTDLVGVTIGRLTGFNARFIVDSGIGEGAEITITRAGDVIPFIKNVVTPAQNPSMPDASVVGAYHWSEPNGAGKRIDLILDDVSSSSDVALQKLIHFFGSIELEFISKQGLAKLASAGYVTPESIITANLGDIQSIVGNANGQKGMASMKEKLSNVKPWFLAGAHPAMGRGVGMRKLKKVFDVYGQILDLTLSQLIDVPGIDTTTANKILNGEQNYKNFLTAIDGYYSIDDAPETKVTTGPLIGMKVAFTGYRLKPDAQAKLVELGGEIHNSVKSDTTHLVAKDPNSGSGKLKKAAAKGIKIISGAEMEAMLA